MESSKTNVMTLGCNGKWSGLIPSITHSVEASLLGEARLFILKTVLFVFSLFICSVLKPACMYDDEFIIQ